MDQIKIMCEMYKKLTPQNRIYASGIIETLKYAQDYLTQNQQKTESSKENTGENTG